MVKDVPDDTFDNELQTSLLHNLVIAADIYGGYDALHLSN